MARRLDVHARSQMFDGSNLIGNLSFLPIGFLNGVRHNWNPQRRSCEGLLCISEENSRSGPYRTLMSAYFKLSAPNGKIDVILSIGELPPGSVRYRRPYCRYHHKHYELEVDYHPKDRGIRTGALENSLTLHASLRWATSHRNVFQTTKTVDPAEPSKVWREEEVCIATGTGTKRTVSH